ncbi:MAG: hypothetical protein HC905_25720 [Bacteroidales bacterium]|nr:hypothetical protein [Bacteroidales bacterium]
MKINITNYSETFVEDTEEDVLYLLGNLYHSEIDSNTLQKKNIIPDFLT